MFDENQFEELLEADGVHKARLHKYDWTEGHHAEVKDRRGNFDYLVGSYIVDDQLHKHHRKSTISKKHHFYFWIVFVWNSSFLKIQKCYALICCRNYKQGKNGLFLLPWVVVAGQDDKPNEPLDTNDSYFAILYQIFHFEHKQDKTSKKVQNT